MRSGVIRNSILILATLSILFLFGCLQKPENIGCCLADSANTGQGCMLVDPNNQSKVTDLTAKTNPEQITGDLCDAVKGFCNVTLKDGPPKVTYQIPICTGNTPIKCGSGNCLAMVCGDFKFKPVIPPSFSGDSKQDTKVNVPPTQDTAVATNLYKAQCRFLAEDDKLAKTMKVSKSSINVFRIGVGGSFDEFEQYKYLLPLSDKYCGVNPAGAIDRYMNYIDPTTLQPFDPSTGITSACFDSKLPPFSVKDVGTKKEKGVPNFSGTPYPVSGTITQSPNSAAYEYSALLPDLHGYKFAYWGRLDYPLTLTDKYDLGTPYLDPTSLNKKIDGDFYKRQLSLSSADLMYGLNQNKKGTTRAAFECDTSANDCFSGTCSTDKYNRVIMLTTPDDTGASQDVLTDCEEYVDEFDHRKIVCAPTLSVTPSNNPNQPPQRTYAKVDAAIAHMDGPTNAPSGAQTNGGIWSQGEIKTADKTYTALDYFLDSMTTVWTTVYGSHTQKKVVWGPSSDSYFKTMKSTDAGKITNTAQDSSLSEAQIGPPAGGALFFGNVDPKVELNGKEVIGYALASNADVQNMLVIKNCNMQPGTDYEVIQITDSPDQWINLAAAFKGYYQQRFSGLDQKIQTGGCFPTYTKWHGVPDIKNVYPRTAYFYDWYLSGMPWVINLDKHTTGKDTPNKLELTSEIATGISKINQFSESYVQTDKGTSCTIGGLNSNWITDTHWFDWTDTDPIPDVDYYNSIPILGSQVTYDLLYSKYLVVFYGGTAGNPKTSIGKCALDPMGLPKTKTYGWCEPCTVSTLAYQKINATHAPYVPGGIGDITNGGNVDMSSSDKRICEVASGAITTSEPILVAKTCSKDADCNANGVKCVDGQCKINGLPVMVKQYSAVITTTCANNRITDANDFSMTKEDVNDLPKTQPEASVLKERIGNYLKSGVMPVLDLSDASNWNDNVGYYDFQKLFANMGAQVVIVDHVNATNAIAKSKTISERASIIHSKCFGCLTAFHVDSPESADDFDKVMGDVFSTTQTNRFGIDLVTYDYVRPYSTIPLKNPFAADPKTQMLQNLHDEGTNAAKSIATLSQTALSKQHKPTMLIGFDLKIDASQSGLTESEAFSSIYDGLLSDENLFIKSGLIGIIYAPVRGKNNLVEIGAQQSGVITDKFCALEQAMEKIQSPPPTAIYSRINTVNVSSCISCSSLDKTLGKCNADALKCQNGVECIPPQGVTKEQASGSMRCPDDTVVDSGTSPCTLCSDVPGSYDCMFNYANGTSQEVKGPMSDLKTDAYQDIIAGLPSPNKCCLADSTGGKYSYVKKILSSSSSKPISFSSTGDTSAACSLSNDVSAIQGAQSFCNVKIPLRDYDVTCKIV